MINNDFSSLTTYRQDGRKSTELRQISIELGLNPNADGSCLFKQGLTQALCLIRGPYQRQNPTDDLLKIQYTVAPFNSIEKRKIKHDREFSEFVENVRKSFEGLILAQNYAKNQIQVTISVIENSGSAKSCVINCITFGLVNAGICMKDLLTSCTVGNCNGQLQVDLNEEEEYERENEMIVTYSQTEQKIDLVEMSKGKLREDQIKSLYRLGIEGCERIYKQVRKALIEDSHKKMFVF